MTTSVYIHIPFCEHICSYCDFCKRFYDEELCSNYLNALEKEIKDNYRGELIKTLYIGGGSPSCLSTNNLKKLFEIVKLIKLDNDYEFTIEVNPENINQDKLLLFKENGVNRISMGIETINDRLIKYLNRYHNKKMIIDKVNLIKKYFHNINVDLIYAIPGETINDLINDLDFITSLNINHISTYSLMINNNTILGIKKEHPIDDELDYQMYQTIINYLDKYHYKHYEVSNFSKEGYASRHNLVYWHNEEYYGFGLGASGYIDNIRYDNTKNMMKYLNNEYKYSQEELNIQDKISYELILGFRLLKGINKKEFYHKYHCHLVDQYNIEELIDKELLIDNGENIMINKNKIYVMNSILENFV